jgi:hypothetical protein
MQNTRVVSGIRTNKSTKVAKIFLITKESNVNVASVPTLNGRHNVQISMEKKNRWEIVEEAEKQNYQTSDKTKNERVMENKQKKKAEYKEKLKQQKQKHEKRVPEKPTSDNEDNEEKPKQDQPSQGKDELADEWKVVKPPSRFWNRTYTKQTPEGEIVITMSKTKKEALTMMAEQGLYHRDYARHTNDKNKHSEKKARRQMNALSNLAY